MSSFDKNFLGLDGFVWFFGVVEDRQDPLGLGRVKVRCYGWHTESLTDIPTENLPWAHVIHSINNRSFAAPREADMVFGFFSDGRSAQYPVIMGIVPGYFTKSADTGSGFHDLRSKETLSQAPKKVVKRTYNKDGSGIKIEEANTASHHPTVDEMDKESISGVTRYQNLANTVIQARKDNLDKDVVTAKSQQWSEPYPAYNALYPYNQANETESGHVFELDDTPGSERIQIAHRSGSFIEWFPSGTKVEKITKSNYQIILADDHLHVMGKVMVTVDGDALIKVKGDVVLEAGNNLSANVAGDLDFSVGGGFNVKAKEINLDVSSDITLVSDTVHLTGKSSLDITSKATKVGSSGSLDLKGDSVNLEGSGVNVKGSSTKIGGGSVSINGSVKLDGVSTINKGGTSDPGGASAASAGSATGLPAALSTQQKNSAEVPAETVPVPLISGLIDFDPETAMAYKYQQLLVEDASGKLVEPGAAAEAANANTSNATASVCGFDPMTRTFISDSSSWDISENGIAYIKAKESFAKIISSDLAGPYFDPPGQTTVYAIGYGSQGPAIDKVITADMRVTRAEADAYVRYTIAKKCLPVLKQSVKVPLTQDQIDALLSFMYNTGWLGFPGHTLVKKLNASDWCAAADQISAWHFVNKIPNAGLISRRAEERAIFLR
jgi:GH24 family phage-related lysozyme (muramidase)